MDDFIPQNEFNLNRLVDDFNNGYIKSAEIIFDPAHSGKPDHIDLHVNFNDRISEKYTNLSGVDTLKQTLTWLQPGDHFELK